MRRQRLFLAAGLVLFVGIASAVAFALAAPEERAPELLLPGDSAVYFGWDGTEKHKADWEKTACYEAVDKTHLLRTLADFALSYIPADSPISQQAVRQLLESLARQGFSLSVGFPKEHMFPRVVLVLHRAAGLEDGFNSAIPKLFGNAAQFETLMIRGRRVTRATPPKARKSGETGAASSGPEFAWWAEGGHLVLVVGEGVVDAALDVADGKTPPISQSANWRKYREEPKDFQAISAGWCDVAALRARYGDFAMQEKTEKEPKFTVRQLIDLLGGEQMGCVALRLGLKDRALVSEITIEAPAPRTGVMALADQAPITLADLPPLPQGNTTLVAGSFNWSKGYDTILGVVRGIADAVTNNGSAKVDEVMKKVPDVLGFDPKSDLCDALGHVVCIHSDSATGIPGAFAFGIAIAVEKPDLLHKTLKFALDRLQAVTQNNVTAAEEERQGRPVWVFDLGQLPFHPAAALDKHWLFIGLTPQAVESSLMRVDGKLDRWKPSEGEQAALNSVPKEFIALSLSDPRPLYGTAVAYLPMLASVIDQAAGTAAARAAGDPDKPPAKRAVGKRMALLADLPPAEVLTRPMFPNVSVGTVDAKGVRFQSRDSVPGFTLGGFVSAPVAVALLLPAVQAAREAARRTESKNHVKQLALAMHNYHDAHGSFPAGTHPNPELKPEKRLSWLVDLLPFVEFKPLYDEIDLKKSWDDPANRKTVELPLALFMNPSIGDQDRKGLTEYVGLAGVGADGPTLPVTSPRAGVFAYDRVTRIQDITDGTSNTIMISECNKELGPWAAGGRATIRALTKKPYIDGADGLGGHPEGVQMGLADGSVRFISKQVDPTVIEALTTINGGEALTLPAPP
jgi:hypothetical protein